MSVEVLDGATIRDFVEDAIAFNVSVADRFAVLDTDADGLLSSAEMAAELKGLSQSGIEDDDDDELGKVYDSLFVQFDHDGDGVVDFNEFKEEMRKVMLAVASGLGFLPVQMVLEEDSFLKRAVDRESAAKFGAN